MFNERLFQSYFVFLEFWYKLVIELRIKHDNYYVIWYISLVYKNI